MSTSSHNDLNLVAIFISVLIKRNCERTCGEKGGFSGPVLSTLSVYIREH